MQLFVSGFLLSLSLCLDLGIVNIAIIKTGIEKGFLPSFNIGLGSIFGDLVYAILSLIGITLILKFIIVRWILWIAGTIILLYFSLNMILQIFRPLAYTNGNVSGILKNKTSLKFFLNGFGLALSSPTAILWFASVGGSVIAAQKLERNTDIFLFLGGFTMASFVWSIVLSYISFKGGQLMKNRIKRIFSVLSACIFMVLAVYVFLDGYKTLIK